MLFAAAVCLCAVSGCVTPLHEAVAAGNIDKASQLLSKGADPNAYTLGGRTALTIAAYNDDVPTASMLIEHGARPNTLSWFTPLHVAVARADVEMVKLLLASGADVNVSRCGFYPIHMNTSMVRVGFAVDWALNGHLWDTKLYPKADAVDDLGGGGQKEQIEVMQLLIQNGADINARDSYGCTALHYVAMSGDKALALCLIEKDAHMNVKDNYGRTPLNLAQISKKTEMAALLKEHGGKDR